MTKRNRHRWLAFIAVVGVFLAWGAWSERRGQDPDNQGGYVDVLLFLIRAGDDLPIRGVRVIGRWLVRRRAVR